MYTEMVRNLIGTKRNDRQLSGAKTEFGLNRQPPKISKQAKAERINDMKYKNIDRNITNNVVGRLSEDGKWYIRGESIPAWNESHRPTFTLYRTVPTNSVVSHTQERVIRRTDLFDFVEFANAISGVKNAKDIAERYKHLTFEQIVEKLESPIRRTSAKQIRKPQLSS